MAEAAGLIARLLRDDNAQAAEHKQTIEPHGCCKTELTGPKPKEIKVETVRID